MRKGMVLIFRVVIALCITIPTVPGAYLVSVCRYIRKTCTASNVRKYSVSLCDRRRGPACTRGRVEETGQVKVR